MIKKIEMPNWFYLMNMQYNHTNHSAYIDCLSKWFNENIEPINEKLDKAQKVYGMHDNIEGRVTQLFGQVQGCKDTHQAYLIDIQPIKQETCADVLRDFVKSRRTPPYLPETREEAELLDRAKAALESES